jgi:hypothetical protein
MTQALLPPDFETGAPATRADLLDASEVAYDTLATKLGYDRDEIHRISVCFDASAIMVGSLVETNSQHETYASPELGEHSFVASPQRSGEDLIGDSTWQQFLQPGAPRHASMPKTLVGTRSEVAARAIGYGVKPEAAGFWLGTHPKVDHETLRQVSRETAAAAQRADDEGKWEAFMDTRHEKTATSGVAAFLRLLRRK